MLRLAQGLSSKCVKELMILSPFTGYEESLHWLWTGECDALLQSSGRDRPGRHGRGQRLHRGHPLQPRHPGLGLANRRRQAQARTHNSVAHLIADWGWESNFIQQLH